MGIEEAKYEVVFREGPFEVRSYAPQVVAEVHVDASLEEAGNKAFNALFKYISGNNQHRQDISMTAPVGQEARSEKLAMTAPVQQEASSNHWAISFMMPQSYTLATLPTPTDPQVALREIPARQMAAVRYRGFWSEAGYQNHRGRLEQWIRTNGLEIVGTPIWARYNPPVTPWFLRRNEVLIPVRGVSR